MTLFIDEFGFVTFEFIHRIGSLLLCQILNFKKYYHSLHDLSISQLGISSQLVIACLYLEYYTHVLWHINIAKLTQFLCFI